MAAHGFSLRFTSAGKVDPQRVASAFWRWAEPALRAASKPAPAFATRLLQAAEVWELPGDTITANSRRKEIAVWLSTAAGELDVSARAMRHALSRLCERDPRGLAAALRREGVRPLVRETESKEAFVVYRGRVATIARDRLRWDADGWNEPGEVEIARLPEEERTRLASIRRCACPLCDAKPPKFPGTSLPKLAAPAAPRWHRGACKLVVWGGWIGVSPATGTRPGGVFDPVRTAKKLSAVEIDSARRAVARLDRSKKNRFPHHAAAEAAAREILGSAGAPPVSVSAPEPTGARPPSKGGRFRVAIVHGSLGYGEAGRGGGVLLPDGSRLNWFRSEDRWRLKSASVRSHAKREIARLGKNGFADIEDAAAAIDEIVRGARRAR